VCNKQNNTICKICLLVAEPLSWVESQLKRLTVQPPQLLSYVLICCTQILRLPHLFIVTNLWLLPVPVHDYAKWFVFVAPRSLHFKGYSHYYMRYRSFIIIIIFTLVSGDSAKKEVSCYWHYLYNTSTLTCEVILMHSIIYHRSLTTDSRSI